MKYRKLTPLGDYTFGSNGQDYIEDVDAVAQAVKTKLLLFYREWWEDLGQGIPMFQSIIGNNLSAVQDSITMLIKDRIQEVPNILSVDEINITQTTKREIQISVRCTTTFGETSYTEVTV